jgi:hypothetical protein
MQEVDRQRLRRQRPQGQGGIDGVIRRFTPAKDDVGAKMKTGAPVRAPIDGRRL